MFFDERRQGEREGLRLSPLGIISKPDWFSKLSARLGLSLEEKAIAGPSSTLCVPGPILYLHPVPTGSPQSDNSAPAWCLRGLGTSFLRCDGL
jgi:hypothetical protein